MVAVVAAVAVINNLPILTKQATQSDEIFKPF